MFLNHYPEIRPGKYRCVYCGKIIKRRDMVVDHVVPVSAAQNSFYARRALHGKGVNDLSNLVPSCARCNAKKGSEFSRKWIRKAERGKNEGYWKKRRIKKAAAVVFVLGAGLLLYREPEMIGGWAEAGWRLLSIFFP